MNNSLTQALIAHFDSVFSGPNGDYPAVMEALQGVSAKLAVWKPAPESNSIWQVVDHLTASKEWQIEILEKGEADPPAWIQPSGEESDWEKSLSRLTAAHARLKLALADLTEAELLAIPVPEWGRTQLELLLSIAAHEAHHGGQVDYLKGLRSGAAKG